MLFLLLAISFVAYSQSTWNAPGASGNWNNAANWLPVGVPAAGTNIVFNGTSVANCIIDVPITVGSFSINAGYTGTVSNTNFAINASSFSQAAGTFTGGTGTIIITNSWLVSGGTFNSTSTNMRIGAGPMTLSGGTFNANAGRVSLAPPSTCLTFQVVGNITFCELEYLAIGLPSCGFTYNVVNTLEVQCKFINTGGSAIYYIGGTINVRGNIETNNTETGGNYSPSTTVFNINGTGTQTWAGSTCVFLRGKLPNINIAKAATDTLIITGIATVTRTYNYVSGVIRTLGTLVFEGDINVTGAPHTISRLGLSKNNVNINVATRITSDTLLAYVGAGVIFNTGQIDVLGDLVTVAQGVLIGGGTGTINIIGTRPQTLYCNSQLGAGNFPNVIINCANLSITRNAYSLIDPCYTKPNRFNYVGVAGNWTYLAGNITGNGIVSFNGAANLINNTHTLPNVSYLSGSITQQNKTIVTGTLTARDTLFTHGTGRLGLFGTTNVSGTVIDVNTGPVNTGTGTINMVGVGTHSFSSTYDTFTGPNGTNGFLPNVVINMPSGTLNIIDTHAIALNWTVTDGVVIGNLGSNVFLHNTGNNLDMQGAVTGTQSFHDLTIEGAVNRNLTGSTGINGRLVLGTGRITLNTFRVSMNTNVPANLVLTTGYVISENIPALGYGRFEWAIGNAAIGTTFIYPFGSVAGTYIPFSFEVQAAGTAGGRLSLATYPTDWTLLPNNTPFPTTVTNINNILGGNNYARELDRYWVPEVSGYTTNPTGRLTFTYRDLEWNLPQNSLVETRLQAHRWLPGTSAWQLPNNTSTRNTTANTVTIPSQNVFTPFTLVDPELPDLRISSSDTIICLGTTVNFFDLNVPTPTSNLWIFPGATAATDSSTATNPTGITYTTTGCKTVVLEATYPGGTLRDTFTCFITVTNPPTASASSNNLSCNNSTNGKVWVTAPAATAGYTYTWGATPVSVQTNTPDSVRTGLGPGTYTIVVNDPASCATTVTATVTAPPALAITSTKTDPLCNNGTNGTASVTVTGGTPFGSGQTYTYTWNGGAPNTNSRTGLSAATYNVVATDASGCTVSTSITLANPASIGLTLAKTDALCNGGATGKVWARVVGGTGTPTFVWSPTGTTSANGDTLYNQLAGTVSVTATDGNGCTATASIVVGQPTAITILKGQTNLACNAVPTGKIWARGSGGTGPTYTYTWVSPGTVSGPNGDTLSGLLAGIQFFSVRDANGCIRNDSIILTQPAAIVAPITSGNVLCFGDSTVTLTVNASGGPVSPPTFTYNWSRNAGSFAGNTAATITNQPAGAYIVTVTKGACTVTSTATVTQPTAPLTVSITPTPITCFNGTNGQVTAAAAGGTVGSGYTYDWTRLPATGLGTGATKTGLGAGTYRVVATDGNGCTATSQVILTNPTQLTVVLTKVDASCAGVCDGRARATLSGGTTPYSYLWSNGAVADSISGLCPGTYSVTGSDANGCTVTGSVTVTSPAAIVITATPTPVTCFGGTNGSATASAPGATGYIWQRAGNSTSLGVASSISGLTAGNYIVIVSVGVCSDTANFTITQPTEIITTITGQNVSCFGGNNGRVTVTSTGGPTPNPGSPSYAWQKDFLPFAPTTATITGLTEGIYSVIVTINGCLAFDTITITEPAALTSTTNQINITCFNGCDGEASVTAAGGTPTYTYAWTLLPSTPAGTTASITNLCAGTYVVVITDDSLCTINDTVILGNPAQLGIVMDADSSSCSGACDGKAWATLSGGTGPFTYTWSNSAVGDTAFALCPGTYSVTAEDANGCTVSASVTILSPAAIGITVTPTNVTCFDGTDGEATVAATGGPTTSYSYQWQFVSNGNVVPGTTNNATASNLSAANYQVIVRSGVCADTAFFTITEPTEIIATITATNLLCAGDSSGTATVAYTGGPVPDPTFPRYRWQRNGVLLVPTTASITNLPAGVYTVIVNVNGCFGFDTITITQPTPLTSTITGTDPSCNGGTAGSTVTVTASGGTPAAGVYNYTWTLDGTPVGTNSNTVTNQGAGEYIVTIRDANNCAINDTFTLVDPPALVLTMSGTDASCFGACDGEAGVQVAGGTGPYTYLWSNAGTAATITSLCPDSYTVTVTDVRGCIAIDSVDIISPPAINITVTPTNVSCFGGTNGSATAAVTGGPSPTYDYEWQTAGGASVPGSTNSATVTGLTAGNYQVIVISGVCRDTATFNITQPTEIVTTITGVNVLCFGGNNGTATVTYTGGPTPFVPTYTWQRDGLPFAQTTATITGLDSATYTVIVTINGCLAFDTITITQPAPLASTITGTDPACNGGTAGSSVTVTPTGGTPAPGGYTYTWTLNTNPIVGATTATVTGQGAGVYGVTITDANSCTATNTFTLTNPPAIVIVKDSLNVRCFGEISGRAWVTISGGTPGTVTPYTITWSGGGVVVAPGDTLTALGAGTYVVTVTDGRGCIAVDSFIIRQPPALGVTLAVDSVSCFGGNDGTAWATGVGGSGNYTFDWAPQPLTTTGPNGDTIINLTSLIYNITITDDSNCTAVNSITVPQPTELVVAMDSNNVSCFGGNDGKAWVTATGGSPNYQYTWSIPSIGTDTISGLTAGTYTVTVTDDNGCSTIDSVIITQPLAPLTIVMDSTNVRCFGQSNGKAWVRATGGTLPTVGGYTYTWSGGTPIGLQDTIINLAINTYTVTVTDANGCIAVDSVIIEQPTLLTLTKDSINVLCFGDATGKAWVTIAGGTTNYNNVVWSGTGTTSGPLNDTLNGLIAGTYTASVTDANGCVATTTFTITQPNLLVLNMFSDDVNCFGDATGKAWVVVTGGTPGANPTYTYAWSPAGTPAGAGDTITGLIAGTYTVTVTDANNCTSVDSITITQPAAPLAVTVDSMNIACFGQATGKAWATVIGGTATYTYTWSGGTPSGVNGDTIINLLAGVYRVTITDILGCRVFDSVTIVEPPLLTVNLDSFDVTCNGQSTGRAWATVAGGTPGYTYTWGSGTVVGVGDTIINLPAGNYPITVTDVMGCTVTASIVVNQPTPLVLVMDSANVTCNGAGDGRAWVTASGATGPYTYVWSSGTPTNATGDTIGNLAPNTYVVTVTDFFQCTQIAAVTIQEPNLLLGSLRSVNVRCFGENSGRAWVTAVGGNGGYSYTWSGGTPTNATGDTVRSLIAGRYTVTITDSKGCEFIDSIDITEPAQLQITLDSIDVLCFGASTGQAWVTVTGGTPVYDYAWSGGTPVGDGDTVRNLAAGTYTVTVTDDTGCIIIDDIIINQPLTPITLVKDSTNILCFGDSTGEASVVASGGTLAPGNSYTYTWSRGTVQGNGSIVTGLSFGIVQVTVTDDNGCETIAIFNITQPNELLTTTDKDDVNCFGESTGKAWVTATGGQTQYSYVWGGGGTPTGAGDTIINLIAGTYFVTVTDANGCIATDSVIVTEPLAPLALTLDTNSVLCFGGNSGRAWATPTGGTPIGTSGYTYDWSAGVPFGAGDSTLNLVAGPVSVTVTDANGCTISDTITINQPATALTIVMDSIDASCFGVCDGQAWVTASGGTAGYTYLWANGGATTDTVRNLCPGNYVVTVTDFNGCRAIDLTSVNEPDELLLTMAVDSAAYCNGNGRGQATVSLTGGTGPYDYEWSVGPPTLASPATSNTITNVNAGPYTVTVTDANGCNTTATITVPERNGPRVTAVDVTPTLCAEANGAITLTVTTTDPNLAFDWSHDANLSIATATGLITGNYTVTITDASTCDTVLTIFVDAVDKPVVDSVIVKDSYCSNEDGVITVQVSSGVPPYTFTWSHDTTLVTNTASNLVEGTYSVTVTDANGCDTSLTASIVEIDAPELAVTPAQPQVIYAGQAVEIAVSLVSPIDTFFYTWADFPGLDCYDCANPIATPDRSTSYLVVVTDAFTGCTDSAYVTVVVKDETNIFIPTAITPNGDGSNDQWVIRELVTFPDNEVIILNRWGDVVFSASPYQNDFDGTYNGKELPAGTYYYIIKLDNISESVSGPITIVK